MRTDICLLAAVLVVLLYACSNEPLPIGSPVRFSKAAACTPSAVGLDEVLKAEKAGEQEYYRALDRVQGVEVKEGDSATVITAVRDQVHVRLAENSVNRLLDNTCWISRSALAK